jgi:hypothetical protein
MRRRAGGEGAGHHEETYEEFTQRYGGDDQWLAPRDFSRSARRAGKKGSIALNWSHGAGMYISTDGK